MTEPVSSVCPYWKIILFQHNGHHIYFMYRLTQTFMNVYKQKIVKGRGRNRTHIHVLLVRFYTNEKLFSRIKTKFIEVVSTQRGNSIRSIQLHNSYLYIYEIVKPNVSLRSKENTVIFSKGRERKNLRWFLACNCCPTTLCFWTFLSTLKLLLGIVVYVTWSSPVLSHTVLSEDFLNQFCFQKKRKKSIYIYIYKVFVFIATIAGNSRKQFKNQRKGTNAKSQKKFKNVLLVIAFGGDRQV